MSTILEEISNIKNVRNLDRLPNTLIVTISLKGKVIKIEYGAANPSLF